MANKIPFNEFLDGNEISLLVSTSKSNLIVAISAQNGQVTSMAWPMPRPTGLALDGNRLAIGTESVIVQYINQPELASAVDGGESADAVYLKRSLNVTGEVNVHDVQYLANSSGEAEVWFVNTKFSCLSTTSPEFSFIPKWKPDWISTLAAEDRCHLNGFEAVFGKPKYVSAFSQTDSKEGWRLVDKETITGVIIDIQSGEIVAQGLHRPHSPRVYRDVLYVLESGTGSLCRIDVGTKEIHRLASMAGFVRGLAFVNNCAIVGLSKITKTSSSNPKLEDPEDLKAAIGVVDLATGEIVSSLRFDESVEEIYDILTLEGVKKPIFAEHNVATGHHYLLPATLQMAFSTK